ncbi:helix-turn-helix transcriptional regulator [Sulfitobacter sp. W074]|uniref:helix-turn-helix transcriptional regulator n=1 Tax=Sulfitobacter sp. W074 TaxID=2867026 RepID=UPI0038FC5E23
MTYRILRSRAVMDVFGFSRHTAYRMMNRPGFPTPIKLGVRAIWWRQSVVAEWIERRHDV